MDVIIDDATNSGNPIELTYFIPIEKIAKFIPAEEPPINNENFQYILATHANKSEDIVQSAEFHRMEAKRQYETLQEIAWITGRHVMGICGDDEVTVDADTFIVISTSDEGPVFTPVNQSDIPKAKRTMPIGKPDGCTFIELYKTSCSTPVDTLEYDYPSIILTDDANNLIYLFPIRALRAVHLVQDTA